jgi:hypothetical protein
MKAFRSAVLKAAFDTEVFETYDFIMSIMTVLFYIQGA